LLGVIAQRLVRRVCPHCAQAYEPTAGDLRTLGLSIEQASGVSWRKGKGCDRCFQSGYLGREAIMEVLDVDDALRALIYGGTMPEIQRHLQSVGFASFRQGAIEKVMAGITTVDEIRRVLPYSAIGKG
jgi:type II secretory ATPase GspE/PulE/Tfp pilus assembly ATPase PilB-like protein